MQYTSINDGGLQVVPQIAVDQQIIYLDFDGELTSYNGEILTVDNVEVQHSELSEEWINNILKVLNEKYFAQNVIFVTEPPAVTQYSTIYIGNTEAFNEYGNFAGLAETIDQNNANKTDKAFVMLDAASTNDQIVNTISHETDHLLGVLNHGGDRLERYASIYSYKGDYYIVDGEDVSYFPFSECALHVSNATVRRTEVRPWASLYVSEGGYAFHTSMVAGTFGGYSFMTVYSGGSASRTIVKNLYAYIDISGGKMEYTELGNADMTVHAGGIAISTYAKGTSLSVDGYQIEVEDGGTVNTTSMGKSASMYVSNGGTAINTLIDAGGYMVIDTHAVHSGYLAVEKSDSVRCWGTIDFTVAERTPQNGYLVTGFTEFSLAKGYTLTVAANQSTGTYKLASDAANFNRTITVKDTAGSFFGEIGVGQSIIYNNKSYSLQLDSLLNGGSLTLTIAESVQPPEPKLADLQLVSISLSSSSIDTSEDVTLSFTIKNIGETAAASSAAYIYAGSVKIGEVTVSALAAGGSCSGTFTINAGTLAAGSHTIKAVADGADSVEESNNENNSAAIMLEVVPSVTPEPTLTEIKGEKFFDTDEVLNNALIKSGAQVYMFGKISNSLVEQGGNLKMQKDGTIENTSAQAGALVNGITLLKENYYTDKLFISGGRVYQSDEYGYGSGYLCSGQSAAQVTVESGAGMNVYAGAVFSDLTVEQGGIVNGFVHKNAQTYDSSLAINNAYVNSAGAYVSSGQSAENVDIISGLPMFLPAV